MEFKLIRAVTSRCAFPQSMFGDWEKFKVAVESSRQPELMLIVDKWQQLQFVSRDYFAKYAPLSSAFIVENFI